MNSRHRMIVAAVAAALLLTACGGSSSGVSATSTPVAQAPAASIAASTSAASTPVSVMSSPPHAPVQAPGASSDGVGVGTAESAVESNPDVSSSVGFDPPAPSASGGAAASATPATNASDACALATVGDVTAAIGGKAAAGTSNAAHSECRWHVVAANFGSDCDVTVTIPAFPDDKTSFDQNKAQGGGATTVPGVGDDAYNPEQGNPSLQFRKGDSVAEVDLHCTSDADDAKESAAVVTLARSVVAKL